MATPLLLRAVEHQATVFRKFWRGSVIFYVLNPVLFLAAMGVGLGGLVDERTGDVDGVPYLTFIAAGLMAASAMLGATAESLWPVMGGMKWLRTYHAMVATPLRPSDVYAGVIVWTTVRAAMGAAVFVVVAALLGAVPSPWGVAAIPAAALTAAAFAAPLTAFAGSQETDARFPVIMRLGVMPLFLFSGTFFPVSQLPTGLQALAVLSPLWHGVELCRGATTGSIGYWAALAHIAVLGACVFAGWQWGARSFTRRLTL
ncbi:MAG: ABC transporter permease [Acidimicrobiia bacterium]